MLLPTSIAFQDWSNLEYGCAAAKVQNNPDAMARPQLRQTITSASAALYFVPLFGAETYQIYFINHHKTHIKSYIFCIK